ncbi:protein-L-isoaspartate O-methyltransferase family protein [Chthonobacter albigriseus]|uniref:protein-L-isoaspartate O-methyltransferase family protein n=1 Tax=Chthonobacter albigriseus TaxID=1683161 RepID=UPI0015EEF256|nr:protein-L-isoaspartate O-methyltransferase [Chthonobacter albigriseus]
MVDAAALRTKMVDGQIRPNDVTDYRILDAMLEIPRELFVPANSRELAYIDRNIPISEGPAARHMLQPMIQARLIQQAQITSDDTVLEVGAGTGYSAAIAGRLAAKVVALEEDAALAAAAKSALASVGAGNVEVVTGPLKTGYPAGAPYDVIIVSGAIEVLPVALTEQLAEGGRLLAIQGVGQAARALLYTRSGKDVSSRVLMNAAAPLLPGFAREPAFEF